METGKEEDCKHPVNPEQKYIRVQEVGMAFVLAWPVMMVLACMYGFERLIPHLSVLMLVAGVAIFCVGKVAREELEEQ